MVGKIFKFQLFALCFLTLVSAFYFAFQDSIPDNYFSISSSFGSFNPLSFYSYSCLVFAGFFLGPWLFFPFLLFTLFYSFVASKEEKLIDSLSLLPLLVWSLIFSVWVLPDLVGPGLIYLVEKTFSLFAQLGLFFTALFFNLFTFFLRLKSHTEKPSFKESLKSLFSFEKQGNQGERRKLFKWFYGRKDSLLNYKSKITVKLSSFLKGSLEKKDLPLNRDFKQKDKKKIKRQKVKINNQLPEKLSQSETKLTNEDRYKEIIQGLIKSFPDKKLVEAPNDDYFDEIIQRIEGKLGEFKIDGGVINVLKGPVVDTFELELGPGVKVSRVNNHIQDLSMALYGAPIRIVYPMKGRTTIGIEVPRTPREVIFLKSLLESEQFLNDPSPLLIAMGKNAFGDIFISDLRSMPHMLVAGATGAGKSVFLNSLLVSLMVKNTPNNLKLLLVDPKQLEFALYESLPHLIMPVVTESSKAKVAFSWVIQEMERRYSILKELSVRSIDGFNEKVKNGLSPELIKNIQAYYDPDAKDFFLPYLVVVVDEFADLILSKNGKDIENMVCRLAAKARASGIHLVLATQRPSVDVITGLIKSNFPTRVSFKVSTSVDSRTILNSMGAEFLLGKGDMLFKSGIETSRVHSAFVAEKEIEFLLDGLEGIPQSFNKNIIDFLENGDGFDESRIHGGRGEVQEKVDELFEEALSIVMTHNLASASMLQRRLKIGYNRAANLIEEMESRGIVGKADGPKPRKVLNNKIDL